MHPHLYELDQVNDSIQQNHRDAFNVDQVRRARDNQPHLLTRVALGFRSSFSTMVTTIGARIRHQPALSQEPNVYAGAVAESADATANV